MNTTSPRILNYPRPHILDQLSLDDHAVIEASAGTGKTYTMEHLVVDILLNTDTRLEEILVVTYTERATADLKKRIRSILETVINAYENPKPQDTTPSKNTDPDQTFWIIDAEANKKLKRALFSFDVAPIHTIHGFCQRVLTENAFDNHRLFDEEHIDENTFFDQVFAEAIRRDFAVNPELSPYINAWMQTGDNALPNLSSLIKDCTRTRGIILPTFHPKTFTTAIHALSDQFLSADATTLEANITQQFTENKLTNKSTLKAIFTRIHALRKPILDYTQNHQSIPHLLADLKDVDLKYFDKHLEKLPLAGSFGLVLLETLENIVPFETAIANLFTDVMKRRLREAKDTQGVFSFDDMLSHVWENLERPGSTLTQVLRQRYKYALIDEFQDTDEIQWQIFRRIFHQSDKNNILYVIGDPKQAIYAFRGADIFTYLRARREILAQNGRLVRLDHNYRSTPDVIDGYNTILDQTAPNPYFTGSINYEHAVQCGKPDLILSETNQSNQPPIHLFQVIPPPGESLSTSSIRRTVAREFALEIRRLLNSNLQMNHPDDPSRTIKPRDIYVLTRQHHEGDLVGKHLRNLGVPCAFYKQEGLFQTQEARDIADLLDAIVNINDRSKRKLAWMTPFFEVPLTTLPNLDDLPESHPLIEHIRTWNQLAKSRRFETLFAQITESSGLLRREIFFNDSERALTNYIHIFEILLEEATDEHLDLDEIVLRLNAYINKTAKPQGEDGNVQRLESEHDAVQIMTLHKSKGLEADIVFIFGGFYEKSRSTRVEFHDDDENTVFYVAQLTPDGKERYQTENQQEAQRLFYVGLTRARARIYLPYIGHAAGLTDKKGNPVSDYSRMNGPFLGLNNRLKDIVTEIQENPNSPANQLFLLQEIYTDHTKPQTTDPGAIQTLATWHPPKSLLSIPQITDSEFQQLTEKLRTSRLKVSSYSHMKNLAGGYQNHLATNDFFTDENTPDALTALGPDALPGGAEAGKFLHAVIELLDFQHIQNIPDLETFANDPTIHHTFTSQLHQYGLNPQHLPYAKKIIFQTLITPITISDNTSDIHIPKIAACTPTIVELEFIFPIPETTHPQLTHALQTLPTDGFEIRRGYIKGFIDLVFQHQDRIYFADWKSDILDTYTPPALQKHIQQQYAIQAQLYTLAMVKMLGITNPEDYQNRFGGFLYLFLRGIQPHPTNPGVHHQRLTWPQILAYQQDLTQLAL